MDSGSSLGASKLPVLLICGPSAAGKSRAAIHVLGRHYDVLSASMDALYKRALFAAGYVVRDPGGETPRDTWIVPERDEPLSLYSVAHELRGDLAGGAIAQSFESELDRLLTDRARIAVRAGAALVVEGYSLRFADDVRAVLSAVEEAGGTPGPVCRVAMRPSLERWGANRRGWARERGRELPPDPGPDRYEEQFAEPEAVEGVPDLVAEGDADLARVAEEVLGLHLRPPDLDSLYLAGAPRNEVLELELLLAERHRLLLRLAVDREAQAWMASERDAMAARLADLKAEISSLRERSEELSAQWQTAVIERAEASAALSHAKREISDLQRESRETSRRAGEAGRLIDAATRHAQRAVASRSWRWGHALARLMRILTFRRPRRDEGALELLERDLERAAAILEPAVGPSEDGGREGEPPEKPEAAPPPRDIERRVGHTGAPPPEAIDLRAWALAAEASNVLRPKGEAEVDVVVCVHDALEDTKRCLRALLMKTETPFHLVVVDDGSAAGAATELSRLASEVASIELIVRSPPHGYTRAANAGLEASTAQLAVLLNSDTEVTHGWLEPVVAVARSEPGVGMVGTLSNAASFQSVPELSEAGTWSTNPLREWATPDGVALAVRSVPGPDVVDVPILNGFCLAITRAVIEQVGAFDEDRFGEGYGEENDLCLRATAAGFRNTVALRSYVQHAKSASYGDARRDLSRQGTSRLTEKHGRKVVEDAVDRMHRSEPLNQVRARVAEALTDPSGYVARLSRDPPLRVSFLLPGLAEGGSGGSHSIVQEVVGLRRLGVDARVALPEKAMDRARRAYAEEIEVFVPHADLGQLAESVADSEVVVGTHHASIHDLLAATEGRTDVLRAYYVQDYEPWFFPAGSAGATRAAETYDLMADGLLFAKTDWICHTVSSHHGVRVMRVEPSLAVHRFRVVGDEPPDRPPRVAAMVRPRTPRRQGAATVELLEAIADRFGGEVEVATFGCGEEELRSMSEHPAVRRGHRGILSRDAVAELFGSSDVFVDLSTYQAFGRTAVEAMACGCAVVGPREGALPEIAGPTGASLVDTTSRTEPLEAVSALVSDPGMRAAMQVEGRRIASGFSIERAALSEYALFSAIHELRVGRRRIAH